jgi:hypothetical protein
MPSRPQAEPALLESKNKRGWGQKGAGAVSVRESGRANESVLEVGRGGIGEGETWTGSVLGCAAYLRIRG